MLLVKFSLCFSNNKSENLFIKRRLNYVTLKKYANEVKLFAISVLVVKWKEINDGHISSEMERDWPELL